MTRYLVLHATNERWEAGEPPGPELVAKVGAMMGDFARAGALVDAAGLRPSSHGARLDPLRGDSEATPGPFPACDRPPAAFAIVEATSLEDALGRARHPGGLPPEVAVEVRPVTEPWDIGLAPAPERLEKRRFMLLFLADDALSSTVRPLLKRLFADWRREGALLAGEILQPTSRGKRLRPSGGDVAISDGPFAETKELVAGYVVLRAPTIEEALRLAARYANTVETPQVELRVADEPE